MQPLRDYQSRAVAGVLAAQCEGHRGVCLVAPTGAGKTRLAEELTHLELRNGGRVLFIAHRGELVGQTVKRLRHSLGAHAVGGIAPRYAYTPDLPTQVATVQSLLARDVRPPADLVIWDEFHHAMADDWGRVLEAYPTARLVGLTATPERSDGKPLGDLCSAMVVAACYSELLTAGHLVPCRVLQPPEQLAKGIALDPVDAYLRHGEGRPGFVFCPTVDHAEDVSRRLTAAGVPALPVSERTSAGARDRALEQLADGRTRILCNVYALTEGVDVPRASICILARGCGHVGQYLQIAGRILRPCQGKADALLVDLTGASLVHGLPTDDRFYSLGDGIVRNPALPPLRICMQCGATFESHALTCPMCGATKTVDAKGREPPRIHNVELREVYAGTATPEDAKTREYQRLRAYQLDRGWSVEWTVREYRRLFGAAPDLSDVPQAERDQCLARFEAVGRDKGFRGGFAAARYRELFGTWPKRGQGIQGGQGSNSNAGSSMKSNAPWDAFEAWLFSETAAE
jgi:DNA repair protein RadD